MTCANSKVLNGYYWAELDGDWELLRYNGKWYTTDESADFSICELVQDCVVIPVAKPLSV